MPEKSPACVDYKAPVGLIFSRMTELPLIFWGRYGAYGARREGIFWGVSQRMEQQDAPTAVRHFATPNVVWSRPRRGGAAVGIDR